MTEQEKLAKDLYRSTDYFIKYSAGRAIACYPYSPGSRTYGETVHDGKRKAQAFLRQKATDHAAEILAADENL